MRVLYISASNMLGVAGAQSTSRKICEIAEHEIRRRQKDAGHTIIELKKHVILPCIGCGKCRSTHRCVQRDDFNQIYTEIIASDVIVIVSPHYAPIPAKLSALLEKMEQITFLHWGKDNAYKSKVYGKPTGIISHGGGASWALNSYKRMVNDTIANALETIQLKPVPLNGEWNTGISIPLANAAFSSDMLFPKQEYDWNDITVQISDYVEQILRAAKQL